MGDGLFEAFIYLLAALVAVPLAKRLGLGSVSGGSGRRSSLDDLSDYARCSFFLVETRPSPVLPGGPVLWQRVASGERSGERAAVKIVYSKSDYETRQLKLAPFCQS
jgi:hypothetical protein